MQIKYDILGGLPRESNATSVQSLISFNEILRPGIDYGQNKLLQSSPGKEQ
jgi:hypothetical protein